MGKEKLTFKERLSYGAGDFAQNGMFTFVSSYLLFYCTDAAGISLKAAGIVLLLGRAADAVLSPLIGSLIDKTHTKWGKCKPYIQFFILPELILLVMIFSIPDLDEKGKVLYIGAAYLMFSAVYAIVSVAYSTLLSIITRDETERLHLNRFKNIGASIGGILVTSSALKIVNLYAPFLKRGFSAVTGVFAVLFFVGGILCAKHTKERVKPLVQKKLRLRQSFKITRKSRAWVILCLIHFTEMFYYTMRTQSVVYYSKYYLGQEDIGVALLTMTQVITLTVAFVMPKLSARIGNRRCVLAGNLLWCLALAGNYFAGRHLGAVLFFGLMSGIGWAAATGIMFVMISETVDYSEFVTGYRLDGFITSTVVFIMKMGTALAGAVTSKILLWGGYTANGQMTGTVERSILLNYIGIPLILSAAVLFMVHFYPVSK